VTRSLILSGGGEYRDPWHPFAATSRRIADLLASLGHEVEISESVADRVADLRGWDLIAVNAAAGPPGDTGALGHDERSYDSAAHRELISRAARWLTGAL
jgi:uncharacterized protein